MAQTDSTEQSTPVPTVNPAPPQAKPRNGASRRRTPNCTHIDMDRLYTRDLPCYVCGHPPSIGFLYVCRQDQHPLSAMPIENLFSKDTARDGDSSRCELRHSLEQVGFSASVIRTAEDGHYTDAQIKTLKAQKAQLKDAIEDVLVGSQINAMSANLAALAAQNPASTDGTLNSLPEKEQLIPTCTFRACHTCRPYYRDRIYSSISSIMTDQLRPLTHEDASVLPLKNVRIMRTIGELPNPLPPLPPRPEESPSATNLPTDTDGTNGNIESSSSGASVNTFKTTQTDLSAVQRLSNPRKRFYSLGSRSSSSFARDLANRSPLARKLKSAIDGIINKRDKGDKGDRGKRSKKHSSSGRDGASSSSGTPEQEPNDTDVGLAKVNKRDGEQKANIALSHRRTGTASEPSEAQAAEYMGTQKRVRRKQESVDLRNSVYPGGHEAVKVNGKLKSKSEEVVPTRGKERNKIKKSRKVKHSDSIPIPVNGTVSASAPVSPTTARDKMADAAEQLRSKSEGLFNHSNSSESSGVSDYSVCSSVSDAEPVEGGFAMTEEGITEHTPDILDTEKGARVTMTEDGMFKVVGAGEAVTAPAESSSGVEDTGKIALPSNGQMNGGAVATDDEEEEDAPEAGDAGLASIMTQV